ncbi:unnamed protein product [Amoebophrya sp. A120]|nr:unnamed protein product [Amoebophrya sp. A120]|eukprot:GSA120T00000988001.1
MPLFARGIYSGMHADDLAELRREEEEYLKKKEAEEKRKLEEKLRQNAQMLADLEAEMSDMLTGSSDYDNDSSPTNGTNIQSEAHRAAKERKRQRKKKELEEAQRQAELLEQERLKQERLTEIAASASKMEAELNLLEENILWRQYARNLLAEEDEIAALVKKGRNTNNRKNIMGKNRRDPSSMAQIPDKEIASLAEQYKLLPKVVEEEAGEEEEEGQALGAETGMITAAASAVDADVQNQQQAGRADADAEIAAPEHDNADQLAKPAFNHLLNRITELEPIASPFSQLLRRERLGRQWGQAEVLNENAGDDADETNIHHRWNLLGRQVPLSPHAITYDLEEVDLFLQKTELDEEEQEQKRLQQQQKELDELRERQKISRQKLEEEDVGGFLAFQRGGTSMGDKAVMERERNQKEKGHSGLTKDDKRMSEHLRTDLLNNEKKKPPGSYKITNDVGAHGEKIIHVHHHISMPPYKRLYNKPSPNDKNANVHFVDSLDRDATEEEKIHRKIDSLASEILSTTPRKELFPTLERRDHSASELPSFATLRRVPVLQPNGAYVTEVGPDPSLEVLMPKGKIVENSPQLMHQQEIYHTPEETLTEIKVDRSFKNHEQQGHDNEDLGSSRQEIVHTPLTKRNLNALPTAVSPVLAGSPSGGTTRHVRVVEDGSIKTSPPVGAAAGAVSTSTRNHGNPSSTKMTSKKKKHLEHHSDREPAPVGVRMQGQTLYSQLEKAMMEADLAAPVMADFTGYLKLQYPGSGPQGARLAAVENAKRRIAHQKRGEWEMNRLGMYWTPDGDVAKIKIPRETFDIDTGVRNDPWRYSNKVVVQKERLMHDARSSGVNVRKSGGINAPRSELEMGADKVDLSTEGAQLTLKNAEAKHFIGKIGRGTIDGTQYDMTHPYPEVAELTAQGQTNFFYDRPPTVERWKAADAFFIQLLKNKLEDQEDEEEEGTTTASEPRTPKGNNNKDKNFSGTAGGPNKSAVSPRAAGDSDSAAPAAASKNTTTTNVVVSTTGGKNNVKQWKALNVACDYLRNYLYVESVAEVQVCSEVAKFYLKKQLFPEATEEAEFIKKLAEQEVLSSSMAEFTDDVDEEALELETILEDEYVVLEDTTEGLAEAAVEQDLDGDAETRNKGVSVQELEEHQQATTPEYKPKKPKKIRDKSGKLRSARLTGYTDTAARWRFTSDSNAMSVRQRAEGRMKIVKLKDRKAELAIVAAKRKAGGKKSASQYIASVRKRIVGLDLGNSQMVNSRSSVAKEVKAYFKQVVEQSKTPYGAEEFCRITLEEAVRIAFSSRYGTLQHVYTRLCRYTGGGTMQRIVPRKDLLHGTNIRTIPITLDGEMHSKKLLQGPFSRPNEASWKLAAWYPKKHAELRRDTKRDVVTARHGRNWGYNFVGGRLKLRNPQPGITERTMQQHKLTRKRAKQYLAKHGPALGKRKLKRFEPCFKFNNPINLHIGDEHGELGGQRARLRSKSKWCGLGHFARPLYNECGELPLYGWKQEFKSAKRESSYPLGRVLNPPSAAAAWGAKKDEILRYQDLLIEKRAMVAGVTTVVETKSPQINRLNLKRFFNDEHIDTFQSFGLPFDMFFDSLDREGRGVIDLQILLGYSDPSTLEWKIESQMATRMKKTGGFKQLGKRLGQAQTPKSASAGAAAAPGSSAVPKAGPGSNMKKTTLVVGSPGGATSSAPSTGKNNIVQLGDHSAASSPGGAATSATSPFGGTTESALEGTLTLSFGASTSLSLVNPMGHKFNPTRHNSFGNQMADEMRNLADAMRDFDERKKQEEEENEETLQQLVEDELPKFLVRQSLTDSGMVQAVFRFRDLFVQFYLPFRARKPAGIEQTVPNSVIGSFSPDSVIPSSAFRNALPSVHNLFFPDLVQNIWQEARERYLDRGDKATMKLGLVSDADLAGLLFFRTLSERNRGIHGTVIEQGRDLATLHFLDRPQEVKHVMPFETVLEHLTTNAQNHPNPGQYLQENFDAAIGTTSLMESISDPYAMFAEPIRLDMIDEEIIGGTTSGGNSKASSAPKTKADRDTWSIFRWMKVANRASRGTTTNREAAAVEIIPQNNKKNTFLHPGVPKLNWSSPDNIFSRDLRTAMKQSLFGPLFARPTSSQTAGGDESDSTGGGAGAADGATGRTAGTENKNSSSSSSGTDSSTEGALSSADEVQNRTRKANPNTGTANTAGGAATSTTTRGAAAMTVEQQSSAKLLEHEHPSLRHHHREHSLIPEMSYLDLQKATFDEFASYLQDRQQRLRKLRHLQLRRRGPLPKRHFVTRDKTPAPESELGKLYQREYIKAKAAGEGFHTPGLAAVRSRMRRDFLRIAVHDPSAPGEKQAMIQDQMREDAKRKATLATSGANNGAMQRSAAIGGSSGSTSGAGVNGLSSPERAISPEISGTSPIEEVAGELDESGEKTTTLQVEAPAPSPTASATAAGGVGEQGAGSPTGAAAASPPAAPISTNKAEQMVLKMIAETGKPPTRIMLLMNAEKEARAIAARREQLFLNQQRKNRKKMQSNDVALDWYDYVSNTNRSPSVLLRKPGYHVAMHDPNGLVFQEFEKQKDSFEKTREHLRRALLQRSDPEKRKFAKNALESVIPVDLGPQELQQVLFAQRRSFAAFERRALKLKKDLGRQTFELNRIKKRLAKCTNPFDDDGDENEEQQQDNVNNIIDQVAVMNPKTGLRQELIDPNTTADDAAFKEEMNNTGSTTQNKTQTIYEQFRANFYAGEWGESIKKVKEISAKKLEHVELDWKTQQVKELAAKMKVPRWTMMNLWDMFEQVDEDGSGEIEIEEFDKMLRRIYRDPHLDPQVPEKLFRNFAPLGTMSVVDFFSFAKFNGLLGKKAIR